MVLLEHPSVYDVAYSICTCPLQHGDTTLLVFTFSSTNQQISGHPGMSLTMIPGVQILTTAYIKPSYKIKLSYTLQQEVLP